MRHVSSSDAYMSIGGGGGGGMGMGMSDEGLYIFLHKLYTVSKKLCQCYFLNNSVKHWPTLIIFGVQHHKET